ncbi:5659_t:CDS:2 [Cetraspora pellucida]|uniref:5659_t:CDS:1 n=1 Tax=Cetraspora pellucida TaxID=1433469 RepID=A0ACA9KP53_9GLOM|nr:5659_t:CDS:2 [Cetraspora pellucida]
MQQANKHTPLTLAIEHYQRLSNISSIDLTNNDISDLVEKYYKLEFNNTPTTQIENVEYDETNKLTSIDSLVIISENIPESTCFNTWDKVENYLNEYAKDYLLRILDLRCCSWAHAYLYEYLLQLADQLNARLKEEVQWSQFHDYKQAIMTNTISIARQDLFPEVVKVIDEYLTELITNAIKIEMSQCLFISANKIEPNIKELHSEQKNNQLESNGFIEDQYDAHLIMLQAIIDEVEWEDVPPQDGPIPESSIFNYKMGILNDKIVLPIRKPTTIPTTNPTFKKSIYKRNLYDHVWRLAREATLLAVEQDDNEIVNYLKNYISRKHNEHNYVTHRSTTNEIFNNTLEIQSNKSSDQLEESEAKQDMIEPNFKNVKNLNKVRTKG